MYHSRNKHLQQNRNEAINAKRKELIRLMEKLQNRIVPGVFLYGIVCLFAFANDKSVCINNMATFLLYFLCIFTRFLKSNHRIWKNGYGILHIRIYLLRALCF